MNPDNPVEKRVLEIVAENVALRQSIAASILEIQELQKQLIVIKAKAAEHREGKPLKGRPIDDNGAIAFVPVFAGNLMRDVLQRQAIELDDFAHKARQSDNFIHAQIFSDMATAARSAIVAWERGTL